MSKLNISDFKNSCFCSNPGWEDKIHYTIFHEYYGFLSIDSWQDDSGITRFQGIVYWKESGRVRPDLYMPLEILKQAKSYMICLNKRDEQDYIVWTLWFDKPIGSIK